MGFFSKIRQALLKTRNGLTQKLTELFSKNKLGDELKTSKFIFHLSISPFSIF